MSTKKQRIAVLGAPLDLGASRRGVDMGPSAIRVADLRGRLAQLGHEVKDFGDIEVRIAETLEVGDPSARYKTPILSACQKLFTAARGALAEGYLPVVLGGDHSVAIGSVAASSVHYGERGERVGLIWFDAHGDANTPETSPSGNIHGMPLAALLGYGDADLAGLGDKRPKVLGRNTALIGVRELDAGEREILKASGASVYTMRDVDERGMRDVVDEAIRIARDGTAGVHVSFDLDVVDPKHAPGTGTSVLGGLTYREAHLAMELCADRANILALDLVEVNPVLDTQNSTAILAAELAASVLGKTIF